jgi:hypothetical protein
MASKCSRYQGRRSSAWGPRCFMLSVGLRLFLMLAYRMQANLFGELD